MMDSRFFDTSHLLTYSHPTNMAVAWNLAKTAHRPALSLPQAVCLAERIRGTSMHLYDPSIPNTRENIDGLSVQSVIDANVTDFEHRAFGSPLGIVPPCTSSLFVFEAPFTTETKKSVYSFPTYKETS